MIVFLLLLLSSCSPYSLRVTEERIGPQETASYFARTPDPSPPIGSQIVIYWKVPRAFKGAMDISICFRDFSVEDRTFSIKQKSGSHILYFSESYIKKHKGILSYRVVIKDCKGMIIKSTQHKMWVSLFSDEGEE